MLLYSDNAEDRTDATTRSLVFIVRGLINRVYRPVNCVRDTATYFTGLFTLHITVDLNYD